MVVCGGVKFTHTRESFDSHAQGAAALVRFGNGQRFIPHRRFPGPRNGARVLFCEKHGIRLTP
ncbi:hypothetical protein BGLA2_780019 [Burkholderia gladioli]|nr:hypothetical protein BGLA2_780019 [Burkholderia gladioli]